MKILIVDDDEGIVRLLSVYLKTYGSVSTASNGFEAIEQYKKSLTQNDPFDLVCLDIEMPILTGIQALEKIREFEKANGIMIVDGVKIIMISGLRTSKAILKSFKLGCEAYITKPFSKTDIINKLTELELIAPEDIT